MAKPRVRVAASDLRKLVTEMFVAAGMTAEQAATTAEPFVWANLRGVESHGVARVPRYLELFASGEANPAPRIEVRRPRPAALVLDADRAPGPLALTLGMRAAIEAARETGVAWATVRATTLSGAIGYYTSLAGDAGGRHVEDQRRVARGRDRDRQRARGDGDAPGAVIAHVRHAGDDP
ncbi:MAG TPA: Ldh family oxidoreductase, partial [Solirubrobacteraceae bacterium]|nr:Ldh family oxidoreductase [Solirubrobacteraceae bacterium]